MAAGGAFNLCDSFPRLFDLIDGGA